MVVVPKRSDLTAVMVIGSGPIVIGCSGAAFQLEQELLKKDIGPRLLALVGNVRSGLRRD